MATVLITGASRGIGLALVRQCAARGDTVIAVCRRRTPALAALPVRIEEGIDLTEDASIAALAQRLEGTALDVLINNAGVLIRSSLEALDLAAIRQQFEVNALGPLRVCAALRQNLPAGAKIALITSRMGSLADNTSGGHYGYRMSKAALNMAGVSLARDLARDQIAVILLHPGYVRTDMTGHGGNIDAEAAATGLLARIDELSLQTSGTFRHMSGESLPW